MAVALARLGLDEAGRGPASGPLVACGVGLPPDIRERLGENARYLRDSKTLTPARRERMAALVREHALYLRVEVVSVADINARGIQWANLEGFRRIVESVVAEEYVVDGTLAPRAISPGRAARIRSVVRADALYPEVSAASLIAKTHHDQLLREIHASCAHCREMRYDLNAGYLSPEHLRALERFGPCPQHHRRVFVATALRHLAEKRLSPR